MTHRGPRLNFGGSRRGSAMATMSVIAIGQRFSPQRSSLVSTIRARSDMGH